MFEKCKMNSGSPAHCKHIKGKPCPGEKKIETTKSNLFIVATVEV